LLVTGFQTRYIFISKGYQHYMWYIAPLGTDLSGIDEQAVCSGA